MMAGHDDLPQLPVIDLSSINETEPGSKTWELTCGMVRKALEEYGCFKALYGKVSPELQNSLYTTLEDFFNFPLETKLDLAGRFPKSPFGGYLENLAHSPLYRAIEVPGVPKTRANLNSPPRLGEDSSATVIESYSQKVVELEKMIKKLAFESLGVGKYSDSNIESTSFSLRMANYKAADKESEGMLGLVAHRDLSFITILHDTSQAGAVNGPGLEIATKDGKHWMKATPSSSSFIVLVGQSFQAWSNGRFHSPLHRVVLGDGKKARYSIGLFSAVTGTTIESPEELVDEDHPLLYKPFKWDDLVLFYSQADNNRYNRDIMADFCGV